jgi:hypothetical protein
MEVSATMDKVMREKPTRRQFLKGTLVSATLFGLRDSSPVLQAATPAPDKETKGAIVLCNHWTQFGIGETFPEGEIRGRWYRRNFSTVFNFERGRHWLEENSGNRVCHEFDAYFMESLAREDPSYLSVIRGLLDSGRMELPGGTYGQAESQVFGYESAIRQLTFGQAAYRTHLGRPVTTYIVEEQSFFPQLPQLLLQAGFKYASIQFQNSGMPDFLPQDLILWESPDGSALPTIPEHPGMLSCGRQFQSYESVVAQLAGRPSPLIFQWLELWVPGMDWGASVAPYRQAIQELEAKGFRQMLLSEYIEWAAKRAPLVRMQLAMDHSNYNNNFFQGGWGYENEKTARSSNQCESMLMAAETICAGNASHEALKKFKPRLPQLWSRLLISQNHDPYLAGSVPAYIQGMRSFQSELAVRELSAVKRELLSDLKLGGPILLNENPVRFFNPCPWPVTAPVLLELDQTIWPDHSYLLTSSQGKAQELDPVFRSDEGNVLAGPVMMELPAYGSAGFRLSAKMEKNSAAAVNGKILLPLEDSRAWKVALPHFEGISIKPLLGEWHQVPSFFYEHPNTNVEKAYQQIDTAPVEIIRHAKSNGMEVATWRQDLMRIKEVPEPALRVQGMAMGGHAGTSLVEFQQRLTSTIRFETGKRPNGTWRFQMQIPSEGLRIVADSPFMEEERKAKEFYCSRYIRLEWPGRQILWCPSQNTLFRRVDSNGALFLECIVFDFTFTGTAQWGMRIYAAPAFTAAESIRLAESYHRRPIHLPTTIGAPGLEGIKIDNPHVLITHVFPGPVQGGIGVRVLNASSESQEGLFHWPNRFAKVETADLEGRPLPGDKAVPLSLAQSTWRHRLRPWEIGTFCVMP